MMELTFKANSVEELNNRIFEYLVALKGIDFTPDNDREATMEIGQPETVEEIKPVLTQEQMAQNEAEAPVHVMPPQPTLEEVRKALKELKDRKGTDAVKALLKAFGADNLTQLKPEDYLGAHDRAIAEV